MDSPSLNLENEDIFTPEDTPTLASWDRLR